MLRAELPAGTPLMAAWLTIAVLIAAIGFATRGKLGLFLPAAAALIVVSAAVMAAFAGLGSFLSVTFRDRKAAMVLTYLTIAAFTLLPFFGLMTWEASDNNTRPQPSWQFLYFTPYWAFSEQSQPTTSFWQATPPMLFGRTPFWVTLGRVAKQKG
jgi:hypothetical protein